MRAITPGPMFVFLVLTSASIELCVSANLLTLVGLPYVTSGGALPLKLHPGTDLLILLSLFVLVRSPRTYLKNMDTPLRIYLGAIFTTMLFAITFTGTENLIVMLDTFLPAGLIAALLLGMPRGAMSRLRTTMQSAFILNAALAVIESIAQKNLIPLYLNDETYVPRQADFRPTALYDHPLTGALMTMMALALAPSHGWQRTIYVCLMWVALVAFGGRMAIGVSLLALGLGGGARIGRMILSRDPRAGKSLLLAGGMALLAAFAFVVGMSAGLADRLTGHLYWDASAQVRLAQWDILTYLDGWQLLFGVPRQELLADLNALRLVSGVGVIENFWLLMFVSLGIGGFAVFLTGFGALVFGYWRTVSAQGRVLLVSTLIVASSSNSLGRKSTVLVCLVATLACLPSGAKLRSAPAKTSRSWQALPA